MNTLDSPDMETLATALLEADDAREEAEIEFQRCSADMVRALTEAAILDTAFDAASYHVLRWVEAREDRPALTAIRPQVEALKLRRGSVAGEPRRCGGWYRQTRNHLNG